MPSKTVQCSYCRKRGHNTQTCEVKKAAQKAALEKLAQGENPRLCGKCRKGGHDRRNCPQSDSPAPDSLPSPPAPFLLAMPEVMKIEPLVLPMMPEVMKIEPLVLPTLPEVLPEPVKVPPPLYEWKSPPPGLPYKPPPMPAVVADVIPPRPQGRVEKHVEFLFKTLRPKGLWTTEYRLLDSLFAANPSAFHLDETSHYSGTDAAPHDMLNVYLNANSRTKYHLYFVMDRNGVGQHRKRYTHLTTVVEGTPVVVARYFLN